MGATSIIIFIVIVAALCLVYFGLRYVINNGINKASDAVDNAFKKKRIDMYNQEHSNEEFYLAEKYIDTPGFEFLKQKFDTSVIVENMNLQSQIGNSQNNTNLLKEESEKHYCGNCGQRIDDNCSFCPECGKKI